MKNTDRSPIATKVNMHKTATTISVINNILYIYHKGLQNDIGKCILIYNEHMMNGTFQGIMGGQDVTECDIPECSVLDCWPLIGQFYIVAT